MRVHRSDTSPLVRLRSVGVEFPARPSAGGGSRRNVALRDIDLDLSPGCTTAIAGPNGAGKSTLLEVIAGTTRPTSGTRTATRSIAFVPQRTAESARLPLTVRDVVSVGAWGRAGRWRRLSADSHAAVDDALARLDIAKLAHSPFATVSGGQRQRALLAQGLARRADLLLLDEPTTGLDAASSNRIGAVMKEESTSGVCVVCVSHDPTMLDMADRVITLADGLVVG